VPDCSLSMYADLHLPGRPLSCSCDADIFQGTDDEIFPIDDMFVALEHGSPKEAR